MSFFSDFRGIKNEVHFQNSGGDRFWIDYHLCVILLPPTPSSFSVSLFEGVGFGHYLDKGTPLYGLLNRPSCGPPVGRGTPDTTSFVGLAARGSNLWLRRVNFGGPEGRF